MVRPRRRRKSTLERHHVAIPATDIKWLAAQAVERGTEWTEEMRRALSRGIYELKKDVLLLDKLAKSPHTGAVTNQVPSPSGQGEQDAKKEVGN
jgi:hypothetical protein